MDLLNTLVDKGLRRELPTREEALAVLATSDDDLLDVVAAAGKVRRHWFGSSCRPPSLSWSTSASGARPRLCGQVGEPVRGDGSGQQRRTEVAIAQVIDRRHDQRRQQRGGPDQGPARPPPADGRVLRRREHRQDRERREQQTIGGAVGHPAPQRRPGQRQPLRPGRARLGPYDDRPRRSAKTRPRTTANRQRRRTITARRCPVARTHSPKNTSTAVHQTLHTARPPRLGSNVTSGKGQVCPSQDEARAAAPGGRRATAALEHFEGGGPVRISRRASSGSRNGTSRSRRGAAAPCGHADRARRRSRLRATHRTRRVRRPATAAPAARGRSRQARETRRSGPPPVRA